MAEFKVIETQEQFDSMIADRIARAKDSVKKEAAGPLLFCRIASCFSGQTML